MTQTDQKERRAPRIDDLAARGRVVETRDEGRAVVFTPHDTTYRLIFRSAPPYAGRMNTPVAARLRILARKLYTVPSGGNFVAPISGPPRTIQGRVICLEEGKLLVQAGTTFVIELPAATSAIDLNRGPIVVGSLVNVVALPGATFEWIGADAASVDA